MKRALVALALALTVVGAAATRVVLAGRTALADGDAAAAEERTSDAIATWETAARWYLPLAPHVDDAYARLTSIAAKDHAHALSAWRAIRSAALATRSLWTPHASDLADANAQIAELASRDPDGAAAGGPDAATRKVWHAARLARETRPGPLTALISLAGIAAWIFGAAYVIARGVDARGFVRRPALIGSGTALAGIATWLLAVLLA